MGRINVLDKHLAELIAAGEVVERPASALKEMVENSIDAGASAIVVEIKNGGNTFMRVTDNGCGIERDDIKKAFLRHATSKIKTEDDLNAIGTLGFRGEALASISAVSKLELITRTNDSDFGVKYVIHGGEELEFTECGAPVGTTIIARDLFYNTPARMKFLKKDTTESNVVTAMLERMAICHPEVSFRLIRDSKQIMNTPGDNDLYSAVFTVFGKDFAKSLLPVDYTLNGISVSGYTCTPTASRKNRAMQYFSLNGWYIRTKTGIAALEQAYKNSIAVGTFPTCVLNIALDPRLVDVNVHPAKIEVRFSDERAIFNAVYYAVKSALDADVTRVAFGQSDVTAKAADRGEQMNIQFSDNVADKRERLSNNLYSGEIGAPRFYDKPKADNFAENAVKPSENTAKNGGYKYGFIRETDESEKSDNNDTLPLSEPTIKTVGGVPTVEYYMPNVIITDDNANKAKKSIGQTVPTEQTEQTAQIGQTAPQNDDLPERDTAEQKPHVSFKYVGQAFDTYIIVESGGKLIIIDKHAAHERILFEKLKSEVSAEPQMLISPIDVTLSSDEYDAVITNLDRINEQSFDIADFGMNTVRVRSVPVFLEGEDVKGLIEEIAGRLINRNTDFTPEFLDWLYHSVACRAAIKAGNRSTVAELEMLADIVLNDDKIRYCPHGRPVAAELTENEIKRRFSRI